MEQENKEQEVGKGFKSQKGAVVLAWVVDSSGMKETHSGILSMEQISQVLQIKMNSIEASGSQIRGFAKVTSQS